MEDKKYLEDLRDIREMMNRSTQFISLSGLSGVLAGAYALVGAYLAYRFLNARENYHYQTEVARENDTVMFLLAVATGILLLSIGTAILMTTIKARKHGEKVWNSTSKRLLANFLIPLGTGGVFALLLLGHGFYTLIAPATLIFYGLACVNASKYTFRDVRYLGITVIILGLLATEFYDYALGFWALGFGVCHIVYGGIMHFKYDRNN